MENKFEFMQKNDLMKHGKTNFDIIDSALACVLFIAFNILFTSAIKVLGIKIYSGSIGHFVLQSLVEIVFAVAALVVVFTRKKNIVSDAGMKNKVNGSIVGWCLLLSFVSLICFGNLTNVFMEILQYFGYSSILGNIEINTFAQYIGYIISSCAIAAFCEELLFRGVILSGFRKFGLVISVFFSALIFMLMHGNAEQTIHQFIIGLLVGYIFYMTNNLWIGFFVHAFNNLIPITEAYVLSSYVTEAEEAAVETTAQIGFGTIVFDLVTALLFAWLGIYFVKLILPKLFKENEKLNGNKNANDTVASIVVDGDATDVEISIDGNPIGTELKEEKPKIPMSATIMFVLAGLYLVGEWLFYTVAGFLL